MDGKTCHIAIQLVLLQCCKKSYTFFVARFSLPLGVDETFFWLRGEENLINSVLKWKKNQYVIVCSKKGVSKNSFPLIFSEEDNREFKER